MTSRQDIKSSYERLRSELMEVRVVLLNNKDDQEKHNLTAEMTSLQMELCNLRSLLVEHITESLKSIRLRYPE